ncbi:unnamed protein product [Caenorhabditis sp. 36 PRJEB53466]|nr:unnamed protein product [Caenorhabditis sp. 36 PRJEB53466]
MEPIGEYMDKVISYLKGIREKDEMVTDGIRKLKSCEDKIIRFRTDMREKQQEQRELLENEREEARKKGFEVEQLQEQLRRLTEHHEQDENELRQIASDINNQMGSLKSAWISEKEDFEATRKTLDETIKRKISVMTPSNRQD